VRKPRFGGVSGPGSGSGSGSGFIGSGAAGIGAGSSSGGSIDFGTFRRSRCARIASFIVSRWDSSVTPASTPRAGRLL
jgi:hypothetical protein